MSESNKPKFTPEQIQQLIALQQQMGLVGSKPQKTPLKQRFFEKLIKTMQTWQISLDQFVNFIVKKEEVGRNDVLQFARPPMIFGFYIILIFVVIGGIWSAFAPLNSAAVAIGTVVANSNKKTIQHQEGGIIKEIFVRQGDIVKEGDKLIELEDTKVKSQYENTLNQYRVALANEGRLIAERDGLDNIEFATFLKENENDPEVRKIMHVQENLFRSQKEMYKAEKDSWRQKIEQLNKQIEGLEAKKIAAKKALDVASDRLKAIRTLYEKGFAQKAALLDIEGREASLRSELAISDTEIARSRQEITRSEIEIINSQNKFTTQTLRELRETQEKVAGLREQFFAYSDMLQRITIKSPVDGVINTMNYHTIGGVVSPGNPILEISPTNDVLVIEAKVQQKNIDAVHVGLVAKIRFSAFKSRTTPLFTGKVVAISPDTVQDRTQGMDPRGDTNYVARIEIDMDEFNKIAKSKKLELHPGMQAEVQIVTGTRTLLRYLLDPVTDVMFKAFREK